MIPASQLSTESLLRSRNNSEINRRIIYSSVAVRDLFSIFFCKLNLRLFSCTKLKAAFAKA